MENNIRKGFRNNPRINPFSDKFDPAVLLEELKKYADNFMMADVQASKMIETAMAAFRLNKFYTEIYDVLKKRILNSASTPSELTLRQIAAVNRHYMILSEKREKELLNAELHFEDNFRQKIKSADATIGMLDPGAALEGEIDALNVALNYIKYFEGLTAPDDAMAEIKYVETTKAISLFSVLYYTVKNCFDDCTWNNGFMFYDKDAEFFRITFPDPDELILGKIGFYRLQRNGLGSYYQMVASIRPGATNIFSIGGDKKRKQRIARAYHANGYIYYGLEAGLDEAESDWELQTKSNLDTYYDYIENVSLPNLPQLDLLDLITMFTMVQHLFRKVAHKYVEQDDIITRSDFLKFPTRVKEQGLHNYLSARSNYTSEQINAFIELLTNKATKRTDFWNYPFLRMGDDLLFPLLTIIDPMTYYLIDCWLEDGGYSLDNRGKFFEDHIKDYLNRKLTENKFEHFIPTTPKFFNKNNEYEEVDLFLNLKNVVLIGEVKCIKYPMGPRDYYNAYSRLEGGSSQVNRKVDFIIKYAEELKPVIGDIEHKEIVKVVITNYPNFTGYRINDVAVIDFFLLESYVATGTITSHKITTDNGTVTNEITNRIVLYDDEKSFNTSLKDSIYKPKSVEQIKPLIDLTENKITIANLDFQIFVQAAEFKAQPNN